MAAPVVGAVAGAADAAPADPVSGQPSDRAAEERFGEWSAMVSAQTVSPARFQTGDYRRKWTGPDGREIDLIVKTPHPAPDAATVTLPAVPAGEDARPYFDAALDEARSRHAARLVLPHGNYVFKTVNHDGLGHLDIRGLSDFTIEGNGSELIFNQNKAGIYVAASQRLKLSDLVLDFNLRLASLGTFEKRDGGNALVVDAKYPVTANDALFYASEYDPAAHNWVQGGYRVIMAPGDKNPAVFAGEQTYTSSAFRNAPVGRTFVLFHYWYGGAAVLITDEPGPNQDEDITLDRMTIHGAPGMGIVGYGIKRGLAILNSTITPAADPLRPVSTDYDAMGMIIVGGDVAIENNRIDGQGDDGVNLNSPVTPIESVSDDGTTFVLSTFSRFVREKDVLAFFDRDGSYLGRSVVATAPKALGGLNHQITIDPAVPGVTAAAVMRDVNLIDSRVAMVGNTIGRCNCHGVLVQIPNSLIENNRFESTKGNSIRLLTNLGYFKEGTGVFNALVRGNRISNSGSDDSLPLPFAAISVYGGARSNRITSVPVNKDIRIIGNTITHAKQGCITVASSRDVEVTGNTCDSTNLLESDAGKPSVNVLKSLRVRLSGNKRSGASTGPIQADPSTTDSLSLQKDY